MTYFGGLGGHRSPRLRPSPGQRPGQCLTAPLALLSQANLSDQARQRRLRRLSARPISIGCGVHGELRAHHRQQLFPTQADRQTLRQRFLHLITVPHRSPIYYVRPRFLLSQHSLSRAPRSKAGARLPPKRKTSKKAITGARVAIRETTTSRRPLVRSESGRSSTLSTIPLAE